MKTPLQEQQALPMAYQTQAAPHGASNFPPPSVWDSTLTISIHSVNFVFRLIIVFMHQKSLQRVLTFDFPKYLNIGPFSKKVIT